MRILFSILLFTAFALRPAMEISTIMYYQLNIDYIVEKYCVNKERPSLNCNGKCYLMSQMKGQTQSSDDSDKTIVITEAFVPLFFQDQDITIENKNNFILNTQHNWRHKYFLISGFEKNIDHPPEYKEFS
ncbi:hypothetical protein [Aquimarina sp. 2201CG5-10]|uniref:hypothetical protein n=1 Tax=Aquimarina callyspongiae TaxID=3098150 RepID=UPI002AB4FCD0|nr:hypothetical protein [Aquimarina sp. 2201CG5-10]MDY8137443.1 hypothetical protein [Aquimarina sp. 2201CG5-10]